MKKKAIVALTFIILVIIYINNRQVSPKSKFYSDSYMKDITVESVTSMLKEFDCDAIVTAVEIKRVTDNGKNHCGIRLKVNYGTGSEETILVSYYNEGLTIYEMTFNLEGRFARTTEGKFNHLVY